MNGFVSIYFDRQSTSRATTTIGKINKVTNVQFAHLVTGDVDAIAWVQAPDSHTFREALLEINSVNGVDHTSTSVAL